MSGFKTTETTIIAANLGFQTLKNAEGHGQESVHENDKKELQVGVDYPYIIQVSNLPLSTLNGVSYA